MNPTAHWVTTLFSFLAVALPALGHALGAPYEAIGEWAGKGALLLFGFFAADKGKVPPL